MSKHTPGPWRVAPDGVTVKEAARSHAQTICRTHEVYIDMLAALQGIVKAYDGIGVTGTEMEAVRAAIAKATA